MIYSMKKILFLFFSLIATAFYSQTLSTSLTACYALNGNAAEPINSLTGTVTAMVTPTVDRFNNPGSAMYFNGTTASYIELPDDPLLKPTNAISFSAWIKPSVLATSHVLFSRTPSPSNFEAYCLSMNNVGVGYRFRVSKGNGGPVSAIDCTTPLVANTWYHVVMTIDNNNLRIYINGVLEGIVTTALTFNYMANKKVYLGVSNESFNLPFNGTIDNARFYNRLLSNTEVNQLFLTDPSCQSVNVNCASSFYALTASGVYESNTGIPNTSTLTTLSLPAGATGLAVGPAFGFPAPNPTFWTIAGPAAGGTYWYFDGSGFINTNHSAGLASVANTFLHPGGSKNFIYNIGTGGGIYKYDGTGNAVLIPGTFGTPVLDVTGDDQDNFYLLNTNTPQNLSVYNPLGVQTCSYNLAGLPTVVPGNAFAIVGNTVNVTTALGYYVGTISGSTINFTQTPSTTPAPTDYANCVISTLLTSTITANPSASLTCLSSTITLSALASLSPVSYTWTGPGILTSVNNQSVQVNAAGVYTCSMSSTTGCPIKTSGATFTVVNNLSFTPTIAVSPASGTLCSGQSATLSASGATSYTWNPGGVNTSSIIVTPSVNTIYTLTSVNGACASTNTIPITVSPTPTLVLAPTSSTICSGSSTTLSVSGAVTYTWMPGTITGSAAIVSPTVNTNYTVTGTNSFGCISSVVSTVIVNPNPTITATGSPTSICSGFPSLLTASGGVSYTWSPVSSNSNTIVVTPSVTTTYSVAGSNSLNCVSMQTVTVFVTPTPTVSVSASPTIICNGSTATLTASGATSYSWMPGSLTGTSVVVSPTSTTVYTITGANGLCTSTRTFTFAVLPKPNLNITAVTPAICSGSSSVLFGSGATSYTWLPGNANTNTLVVTPTITTSYTLTGANASGCTNTTVTTVTVNTTPTVTINSSTNTVCSGNSATLTLNGAANYLTFPGAQSGSVIVVSPTVNTTYTISGLSSALCPDTETITITIAPGPTITATSSATLLCDGLTFSLSASGATNYTWMPVNITGSVIAFTATTSINTYTVIGETGGCTNTSTVPVVVISCANNMFGITKAASKPVLVYNTYYNVTFTVTAVNASTINLTNVSIDEDLATAFPSPTNFSVVSQPIITSQNSGLVVNPIFDGVSQISLISPATSTLLANKRDTIVFTVRVDPRGYFGPFKNSVIGFAQFINNVIVSDSSNNGFIWDPDQDGDPTNNDTATVIDLLPINLFIPDGFSPNGDGINDVFFIKGMNARPVKLTVFNRWGNKVYERSDYDNSWDGTPNTGSTLGSNKVPQGTYYYIIEFLDGDKETRTGFVVIQY